MLRSGSIARIGLLIVLILLATEVVFVGLLCKDLYVLQSKLTEQENDKRIAAHLTEFSNCSLRRFVVMFREHLLGADAEIHPYQFFDDKLRKEYQELQRLLRDDPATMHEVQALREDVERISDEGKKKVGTFFTGKDFTKMLTAAKEKSDQLQEIANRFSKHNIATAAQTAQSVVEVQRLLIIGLIANVLTTLGASVFFWKGVSERINKITDNIGRLARREPLQEPIAGNDEIAVVDAIFHQLSIELLNAANQEESLVQNSTDVLLSLDSRGILISASPACREQWGYEPEDLMDRDVDEALGAKNFHAVFEQHQDKLTRDYHFTFEETVKRSDGTTIDTIWSASWSADDGTLFCFVRDCTESKRIDMLLMHQENQVRQSIANMPLGILTVDENGQIKSANKTAHALFNCGDLDLTTYKLDTLIRPSERAGKLSQILTDPTVPSPVRCEAARLTGANIFVDVTAGSPAKQEQNDTIVLFEDASERVKLEELKRDYVTLLGQNLREPLKNVRHIVSSQPRGEDQKRNTRMDRTVINIDRLLKLIEELLDIEKLATGKLVGELTPSAVNELISTAVNTVSDHAEQQKIKLEFKPASGEVLADQQRIVQVIVNLLTNAIKYSNAGTTVSLEAVHSPQGVEIRVADQGRGLPADMKEKVFESYVQTQTSDAKRGSGTGLGLAICKQIVERHNGTIGVDSELGKGSVFWIRLPRLEGPVA